MRLYQLRILKLKTVLRLSPGWEKDKKQTYFNIISCTVNLKSTNKIQIIQFPLQIIKNKRPCKEDARKICADQVHV